MTPPPILTAKQLHSLWYACTRVRGVVDGIHARFWWPALFSIVWETKKHPSNFLDQLTWDQLPIELLHPATKESLERVRKPDVAEVLHWPGRDNHIWRHYSEIQKAAGLPHGKAYSFRCLIRCSRDFPRYFHPAEAKGVATCQR